LKSPLPFQRRIRRGVIAVVAYPKLTLTVSAIVLAASVVLALSRLSVSSNDAKLFPLSDRHIRESAEFDKQFPENDALYVVIQSATPALPPIARWTALADRITERLLQMPNKVHGAECRVPIDQLGTWGLLFQESSKLNETVDDLKRFVPLVTLWAERPGPLTAVLGSTPIERFVSGLLVQPPEDDTRTFVAALSDSWVIALQHSDAPLLSGRGLPDFAQIGASDPSDLGYFYQPASDDPAHHVLLVRVYPKVNYDTLTAISDVVESIRAAVRDVSRDFPEFAVGTTGRPALSADEMRTSDEDSDKAEIAAMCTIFLLLAVLLRSIWLALAAEIALAVAIGWTFGWATITIGELNLLSLVFLIALIGIGMDYLVQILMAYRREARRRLWAQAVWARVFRSVGAPINTACMGAAAAFLVSALTRFRGASDLGIIAGGGLLLCLLSGYTVLPALLTLFPPKLKRIESADRYAGNPARAGGWRLASAAAWAALLLVGIPFAFRARFNPNLLDLQAPKLPSVQLVRKIQSWSNAVLSHDLDRLRAAREALRPSPLVSSTDSILSAYDNYDWLQAHQGEMPHIDWTEPAAVAPGDLARLANKLRLLADRLSKPTTALTTTQPAAATVRILAGLLDDAAKDPARARAVAARLSAWQTAFVAQLRELLQQLTPPPLDVKQLPVELRSHYLSDAGSYALYVFPAKDLWRQGNLKRFVTDTETRAGRFDGDIIVTGVADSTYHSTRLIERSFYQATTYSLIAIVILVLLDLRNVRHTLLAVSVLALGLPVLVALMGLFDINWNLANFFGLPILIGAGHEYGVFLVHRYREAAADPHRFWKRRDASDRALLLCALITCSSFGFFWALGHHRGLRSLGLVMWLGIGCIYLAAVFALRPLLLRMLRRRGHQGSSGADESFSHFAGSRLSSVAEPRPRETTPHE
jgi:uncharacterized protein